MMKIFTTFLLGTLCFAAVAQDTTYFDAGWKPTTKADSKYFRIQTKEGNLWTRSDYWSMNKQLQMKGNLSSLEPELKEGYYEWFHENGQLKHKGNYLKGKETGEHFWYTSEAKIEAIENWTQGVMNGKFEEYHSNGNLSIRSAFLNGLQNGRTEYYREDGTKQSEGNFLNGYRDAEWKYFGESGDLLGTNTFKTEYEIPEASIFLKLPNDEWDLANQSNVGITQYIFKRNEIIDTDGRKVVPAIMLYIEDATKYKGDVTVYSITKRTPFMEKGIIIETTLIQSDENYPLSFKNGYFMKATYSSGGIDHIFYMIHLITDDNKGVQIYMDMTKDIAGEYESEFWTTIKSLHKL
jgi:antitoxin component YwqK of YwqJK toxin-antitoxin module